MRAIYLMQIIVLVASFEVFAGVSDPVGDFKAWYSLEDSRCVYKWTADLNGDGKSVVFLCGENSYAEDQKQEGGLSHWYVYVPDSSGGYKLIRDVIREDGVRAGAVLLNLDCLYVGEITQLGKRGWVTTWVSHKREKDLKLDEPEDTVYICAYIPVGDHFEQKIIKKFDAKEKDDVYEQYFSDSRRATIKMERIPR
jgi:hypothetical protein